MYGITGSSDNRALVDSFENDQEMSPPRSYPRRGNRGTRAETRRIAVQRATQRIKAPRIREPSGHGRCQACDRAVKRAPRHESKVQQRFSLEVAITNAGWGIDLIHTNTTRSHVGGNHDRALVGLELVQNPVALVLLLVAVDGWRVC